MDWTQRHVTVPPLQGDTQAARSLGIKAYTMIHTIAARAGTWYCNHSREYPSHQLQIVMTSTPLYCTLFSTRATSWLCARVTYMNLVVQPWILFLVLWASAGRCLNTYQKQVKTNQRGIATVFIWSITWSSAGPHVTVAKSLRFDNALFWVQRPSADRHLWPFGDVPTPCTGHPDP